MRLYTNHQLFMGWPTAIAMVLTRLGEAIRAGAAERSWMRVSARTSRQRGRTAGAVMVRARARSGGCGPHGDACKGRCRLRETPYGDIRRRCIVFPRTCCRDIGTCTVPARAALIASTLMARVASRRAVPRLSRLVRAVTSLRGRRRRSCWSTATPGPLGGRQFRE
jgi:hypothetical protein